MSLSARLFGRDSLIHRVTNILGLGIPTWLDKKFGPKDTEGPRLKDLTIQSSEYGQAIKRTYGTMGFAGNLIYLENNRLKETVHKKKSGGKGGFGSKGGSKPTKTYTYSATFIIALCEGPIQAIGKIWCGDKLIYNPNSNDLGTVIASNQAARGFRIYLGTDSQMPDPRYQAAVGAANAPAYRGLAYIFFDDFQLEDYGNTLRGADFKVEVMKDIETQGVSQIIESQIFDRESSVIQISSGSLPAEVGYGFMWNGVDTIYKVDEFGNPSFFQAYSAPPDADYNPINPRSNLLQGPSELPLIITPVIQGVGPDAGLNSRYWQDSEGFIYKGNGEQTYNAYVISNKFAKAHVVGGISSTTDAGLLLQVSGNPSTDVVPYIHLTDPSAPTGWCGFEDKWYCLAVVGPDQSIVTFDLDFSSYTSVPLTPGAITITNQGLGAYCDGVHYWGFTGAADSSFRDLMQVEVDTGKTTIYKIPITTGYSASRFSIIRVWNGLLYELAYMYTGNETVTPNPSSLYVWRMNTFTGNKVPLADIIQAEVAFSDLLGPADISTSDLTDLVNGYMISGGTIRSALEPLQAVYPFDVIQAGYKTRFVRRGKPSVVTIPYDQLGADENSQSVTALKESFEMASQLPQKTTVKYFDASREYSVSEQYFDRASGEAVNKVDQELAVVLSADEAAGVAEMMTQLPWLERTSLEFTLPPIYVYLEPSDCITLTLPTTIYNLRLSKVEYNQNGTLKIAALPNYTPLYFPESKGGEAPPPDGHIPYGGTATFVPMDIPVVDEVFQDFPGFVGMMYGASQDWPGGMLLRSLDGGQTWADLQGFTGPGTFGNATNTLAVNTGEIVDFSILKVVITIGELESITLDQMAAGLHYVAYGQDGRWEIMRFMNAELTDNHVYEVSGFIRGDRGTEWATGLHQVGDLFVILQDPDNAFVGTPVEFLNSERLYGAVSSGGTIDDMTQTEFNYKGVNLEPLSPVYPVGTRDGSSNLNVTFTRRSRLSSAWWAIGTEAPVGETTLAFEADIMDGTTVKRTISSSTESFTYSAADQTSDFGSPQASITVRIYQLSSVVGRGYPLEVTL